MPIYEFRCDLCKCKYSVMRKMEESGKDQRCPSCGALMNRVWSPVAISGTRDSFGIGKEFVDSKSGKTIDTWNKWEKAGYIDPRDSSHLSSDTKAMIARKAEKINLYDNKKKFSVGT